MISASTGPSSSSRGGHHRKHRCCFGGILQGISLFESLKQEAMIAATTVIDNGGALGMIPREVAAVRVHYLAAAIHGPPHPMKTMSPKAIGSARVHSLVAPTQTESRSVSVRRNVVPRWHGSSQQSAMAKGRSGSLGSHSPLLRRGDWDTLDSVLSLSC